MLIRKHEKVKMKLKQNLKNHSLKEKSTKTKTLKKKLIKWKNVTNMLPLKNMKK